jgi:hypothetical protein
MLSPYEKYADFLESKKNKECCHSLLKKEQNAVEK